MNIIFLLSITYLVLSLVLRVLLLIVFTGDQGFSLLDQGIALGRGLLLDVGMVCMAMGPVLFFVILFPRRLYKLRIFRGLRLFGFFCALFGLIFLVFLDYFFFAEFLSRFNYIAVDYLLYPHEVFVNIWESYPLIPVLLVTALFAAIPLWFFHKRGWIAAVVDWSWTSRFAWLGVVLVAGFSSFLLMSIGSANWNPARLLNEITQNSAFTFFYSLRTAGLDYNQFYSTLPKEKVWQQLHTEVVKNSQAGETTERRVQTAREARNLNVVYIIEESLGAEFSNALGGRFDVTPEFDKLVSDGLLFDHTFATGNRTIRGLEAILASFPPLPGRSVVKRDNTQNFFCLPRVLKDRGYQTLFVYGGHGTFDNMKNFMLENGYDRFVEQGDLETETFETAWGFCDEDIFNQALVEMDRLHEKNRPFFTTVLSISNHRPFTYPRGRIPEDPDAHERTYAVKYADYALGKFFREARDHPFFEDTIFMVVGDHGARIYGSRYFPLNSYQVPLLLYCPKYLPRGVRNHRLASSMDISPTVLGLLGGEYTSLFYGRDLLDPNMSYPFVVMQHNRDVALFDGNKLVSLGLSGNNHFFQVEPETLTLTEVPSNLDLQHLQDLAISIYQTAYQLYEEKRYQFNEHTEPNMAQHPRKVDLHSSF